MSRTYIRCVAIFVLPGLMFLWLMDAVGETPLSRGNSLLDRYLNSLRLLSAWSSATRNGSFWSDWGWLIGLLILGLLIFCASDWFYERRNKSLIGSIAALLDQEGSPKGSVSSRWESSFVNISVSRKFHGRAVTVTLRASYAQRFNYNSLRLDFACRSPWPFEVKRRSVGARFMELLGQQQLSTGDATLDETLVFLADDPSFDTWVRQPEIRKKVLSLIVGRHVASINASRDGEPSVLQIRYAPLYLLQYGLVLEGIPGVLNDVEALAVSLEEFRRSSAEAEGISSTEQNDTSAEAAGEIPTGMFGPRLIGPVLIITGFVLLSGIPLSLWPQPNQLAAWLLVIVPWLGLGMLITGAIIYRRSRHSIGGFRENILEP